MTITAQRTCLRWPHLGMIRRTRAVVMLTLFFLHIACSDFSPQVAATPHRRTGNDSKRGLMPLFRRPLSALLGRRLTTRRKRRPISLFRFGVAVAICCINSCFYELPMYVPGYHAAAILNTPTFACVFKRPSPGISRASDNKQTQNFPCSILHHTVLHQSVL